MVRLIWTHGFWSLADPRRLVQARYLLFGTQHRHHGPDRRLVQLGPGLRGATDPPQEQAMPTLPQLEHHRRQLPKEVKRRFNTVNSKPSNIQLI